MYSASAKRARAISAHKAAATAYGRKSDSHYARARLLAFGADEETDSACVVCYDHAPPPIQSGCACRGTTGLAHVACRAKVAASKPEIINENWWRCATCKQPFTGRMQRGLSGELTLLVQRGSDLEALVFAAKVSFASLVADGRYDKAERNARVMHDVLTKEFGEAHNKTLAAAGSVAVALSGQGRYAEAAQVQRGVLDATRAAMGRDDIATQVAMGALTRTLSLQGAYAEADALFGELIEVSQRINGADHVRTLAQMGNFAQNLAIQGKYAAAEPKFRAVLARLQRVLGPDHPQTLLVQANLANSLFELGKLDEAVQLQAAVLAAQKRVLEPGHQRTTDSERSLERMQSRAPSIEATQPKSKKSKK
jgi:hypothetical protein